MKKFIVIGAVIVALLGVLAGAGIYKMAQLGHQGKRYANRSIVAVVSEWDEKALLDRGSEEFTAALNAEGNADRTFFLWSQLGRLIHYGGAKGFVTISYTSQTGLIVVGHYAAAADFTNGNALIRLLTIRRHGRWRIVNFRVIPTRTTLHRHAAAGT